MKRLILFALIITSSFASRAQFVTIPDANFVSFLQTNYPAAMTGNQMDTTHISITSETSLTIPFQLIYDIYGVQFFNNLTALNTGNNDVSSLYTLASGLTTLYCGRAQLTSLPTLPSGLTSLDCSWNQLTSLPTLPNALVTLNCENNPSLSSLPNMPTSLSVLDCSNNSFATLLPLSNSLTELDCSKNQLTSLPTLPNTLTKITCNDNALTSFPTLPTSLTELRCHKNQIPSLSPLPSNLTHLECWDNQITNLGAFPMGITLIACNDNMITSLSPLPTALTFLNCDNNQIANLPALPASLTNLYCNGNLLTSLPALPAALNNLSCMTNQITTLPTLPNLTDLRCSANPLTSVPTLPNGLLQFFCSFTPLTSFPALPNSITKILAVNNQLVNFPTLPTNLKELYCGNNPITTLPTLPPNLELLNATNCALLSSLPNIPNSLDELLLGANPNLYCLPYFTKDSFIEFRAKFQTGVSCLPRAIWSQNIGDSSAYLPICTPTSGCAIAYNVTGNTHEDTSSTCALDSLNNGIPLKNIKFNQYTNNSLNQQFYSNHAGFYSVNATVGDSITIHVDTSGMNAIQVSCPTNGMRIAKLTPLDSVFTNQDFGIKCTGYDLSAHSIYGTFRAGVTRPIYINAGDLSQQYNLRCANTIGGTVTTTISGAASYAGPMNNALTPSSIVGNTLTYNIADFGAVNYDKAFNILVATDTNALPGSNICINTSVLSTPNDLFPINDTLTFCGPVLNSFDPNNKSAYPENAEPDNWITYNIRFQNTGTDTAYYIAIRDTLSNFLDVNTFTYLAGSVRPQITINGNAVLFSYPNINLVDSNTNEPESHGWLQYKIKTAANLPLNSIVENTAYIYFDNNSPIVTNTTMNEYTLISTSNSTIYGNVAFQLYPNPSNGALTIKASQVGQFELVNLLGKQVYKNEVTKSNTSFEIQLPELAKGIYIYQYYTSDGSRNSGKLLIK